MPATAPDESPDPPELVRFGLEAWKRRELEAIAAARGLSFDELVSEAVAHFLETERD